jgi:hypothetical protein
MASLHNSTLVSQMMYTLRFVRFEDFAAVTMMNAVFWDVNPSLYFTGDTLLLRYRVQPLNAM